MAMASLELPLQLHLPHAACLSPSSKFDKDCCFLPPPLSCASSCSLRRSSSPLLKESLPLRCRAPCCMSLDVDSEPVDVDGQPPPAAPLDSLPRDPRGEERFAVLNTGKWQCRSCGYVYDEFVGDPSYPIAAGLEFGKLPEDWRCPTCGAARSYFNSKSVEVAGFAENQKFGFGTNSLTAGQKSILIYGSLLLFFLLFLSGYFLQ